MRLNYLKHKKGIALVEVIAALGIAVVVITSLVSLTIFTMRSSLRSKLLLEGTKYASKQIELVRAYRDANSWDDFKDGADGLYGMVDCDDNAECYITESLDLQTSRKIYEPDTPEQVDTYFTVTQISDDSINVTAVAEWTIGGETKSTQVYTTLSNWRDK